MREEDHTLDELVSLHNSKSVIFHDVILLFYCIVHFAHIGGFCCLLHSSRMGRLCFRRCLSVHRGRSGERREVPLVTDPWTLVPGSFPGRGRGERRGRGGYPLVSGLRFFPGGRATPVRSKDRVPHVLDRTRTGVPPSPLDRTRHGQEDFLILKNKVV